MLHLTLSLHIPCPKGSGWRDCGSQRCVPERSCSVGKDKSVDGIDDGSAALEAPLPARAVKQHWDKVDKSSDYLSQFSLHESGSAGIIRPAACLLTQTTETAGRLGGAAVSIKHQIA